MRCPRCSGEGPGEAAQRSGLAETPGGGRVAQERMEGATSTNVETGESLASADTQLWLEQAAGRRTVWPRRARARCVRPSKGRPESQGALLGA